MKVGFKVTGEQDLAHAMRRLDSRQARNGLSRALVQSVRPVAKLAKQNVDAKVGRDTGEGRKAIRVRTMKKQERERLGIDQGALLYLHADGFYLAFWEFGFVRSGQHYPARPWMRTAVDSELNDVVVRYLQNAGRIIRREVEKKGSRR